MKMAKESIRRIEREQRAIAAGLVCAIAFAVFLGIIFQMIPFPLRHVSTVLYTIIIIVWMFTVQERILDKKIRHFLMLGALSLAFLFILRLCRWDIFGYSPKAGEFLWCSYYTVYIIVPLFSLCAAVCVGKRESERMPGAVAAFWGIAAILCTLVMTNHFHGFLFLVRSSGQPDTDIAYRFLYYVVAVWYVSLNIAAITILVLRCRLSASRRLWYIPTFVFVFFIFLMAAYYAAGGAPMAFGHKLYNIQEIHMLLYIGMWECFFQIGLIPTNSGYSEMFHNATYEGLIVNENGEVIYRAAQVSDEMLRRVGLIKDDAADLPDGHRMCRARISGGQIYWMEDHATVNALKDSLNEALEQIAAENTLLCLENEMKEQKALVETQNRIYDGIVAIIEPQLTALKEALEEAGENAQDDRLLVRMAYLAAYIKRRSNLALIAEDKSEVELSELYFAIRESLDYAGLSGMTCDVRMSGGGSISVESLVAAYEIFEYVLENAAYETETLMVNIGLRQGLCMNLMTEAFVGDFPETLCQKLSFANMRIDRIRENEVSYISVVSHMEGVLS